MHESHRLQAVEYSSDEVISYAQNYEDVLLHRVFRGKRTGFYIDVGTGDPNWDSVTRWFYGLGWRGINVEPNPLFHDILAHHRPDEINLNIGISIERGDLPFQQVHANELGQGWGLSSFDPASEQRAKDLGFSVSRLLVSVVPLQDVVDEYCSGIDVDFIKIDVEGLEASVLRSVDWTAFRPAVICVEAVQPNSAVPSCGEWENLLLSSDYEFGLFDGVNNFYVRHEAPGLLTQFNSPVNCNDRFRRATPSDV